MTLAACAHRVGVQAAPCGNSGFSEDVPVIALFERRARRSGFDVPTLLVWSDGTVMVSEGVYGSSLHLVQSTTSQQNVRVLARSVAGVLRESPALVGDEFAVDVPTVEIVFRDGATWKAVNANRLSRETVRVPPSARDLASVYRQLLRWRPTGGVPAPTTCPRPARWPEWLPTYRGQGAIDQIVHRGHGFQ